MLLAAAPTAQQTERLRRTYAKLHCFVHCASYKNLVRSAEEYSPDVILLEVDEVTDLLVEKIKKIRLILPNVALITLANVDVSRLAPDLSYSLRPHHNTLLFQALYFSHPSPNASILKGGLIVSGLLLSPLDRLVFLSGHKINFTPEEVFLLRYLAEIHPRRADARELGKFCFTYGRKIPRSTVVARISRINKKAKERIGVPILTQKPGEGYGIDF